MHISLWDPNGINPWVLKELADVTARQLSMFFFFLCLWESEGVLINQKLANIVLVFNKDKKEENLNYTPVSLNSVSGKNYGEDYSESFPGGEVMQSLVTGNMNPQGKISFHPTYSFMTKLSTVY